MFSKFVYCFYLVLIVVKGNPVDETQHLNVAVQSNEKFASNLFKNIDDPDTNLVISPLSAQLVTEFLRLGAGGNTAKQIKDALHLPESGPGNGFKLLSEELKKNNDTTIKLANRVYVSTISSLHNDFQKNTKEALMADAVNVDFNEKKTRDDINNWVEQQTENKIKDFIAPGLLTPDTSLLLVNTLYFKGLWDSPFDVENRRTFHKTVNESVETDFLYLSTDDEYDDIRLADLPELSARILDIPYKGKKVKFVIILPNEDSTLKTLEEKISDIDLDNLLNKTHHINDLRVSIPKFKIESSIDLKQAFSKMGMTDMFTRGVADFSEMTNLNTPPIYVSDALQKIFIEINKHGTEAAAATVFKAVNFSAPYKPPKPFIADRPFLFYIIHKTTENHSTVLFSGRFVSP